MSACALCMCSRVVFCASFGEFPSDAEGAGFDTCPAGLVLHFLSTRDLAALSSASRLSNKAVLKFTPCPEDGYSTPKNGC